MNSESERLLKLALGDPTLTFDERRALLELSAGRCGTGLSAVAPGISTSAKDAAFTVDQPVALQRVTAGASREPPSGQITSKVDTGQRVQPELRLLPWSSRYRLPADRADVIRSNPPINLTVLEAAAYLRVSPRKIRYLIAAGNLKHARIGARIVVRREYLDVLASVS